MAGETEERELGHWTVNYVPPDGGRFTGRLQITDQAIVFASKQDMGAINDDLLKSFGLPRAARNAVGDFAGTGSRGGVRREIRDEHFTLRLERSHVLSFTAGKRMLLNRVTVAMDDGSTHVFDYGLLSVKKMVAAWEAGRG